MIEIEVQNTINHTQVIDRTVSIVDDEEKVILEYYELIQEKNGDVRSDKTFCKARHERNKNSAIKLLRKN